MENIIKFIKNLGYIEILASLFTILITELIKITLKKKNIINEEIEETKKDTILTNIGRFVGIIVYICFYITDGYFVKKSIEIDLIKITSSMLISLTISKGIYTWIKQMKKKKTIYEKLKYAEETIKILEKTINKNKDAQETLDEINGQIEEKWVMKGKILNDSNGKKRKTN